jgi:hypothetical protein
MTHVIFSSDGSALLYADVFGVTRLALGKAVKVKHTAKVSAHAGDLSMNAAGTLALVRGRVHTAAHGNPGVATLGLPALGLRDKVNGGLSARALTTTAAGDRSVSFAGSEALLVQVLEGETLRDERTVPLPAKAAVTLAEHVVGPQCGGSPEPVLLVEPDGRFVLRGYKGVYAGRLGADDAGDAVWWAMPLAAHRSAEVTLALVDTTTWVFVRDARADVVRALRVERDGALRVIERPSLAAPAVDGDVLLTQPESGAVVAWSLADGSERRYDVSAFNAHPAQEPDEKAFPVGRPPAPTRLPGALAARGASRWFVPWHRETLVDLERGVAYARGLDAGPGPLRRLLLEAYARLNESLRGLHVEVALSAFEKHPKEPRVSLAGWTPPLSPDLAGQVAQALTHDLHNRYEIATHGYRWSSYGHTGGYAHAGGLAPHGEVRAALAWMRDHDVIPTDIAGFVASAYDDGMGIPSEARPAAFPFDAAGERLFLRAALEALAAGGWTVSEIPAAWSVEAPSLDLVRAAIAHRAAFARYRGNKTIHMLSKMLARHLGPASVPALVALIEGGATAPLAYDDVRCAGEALTWVVHHHPSVRDEALAAVEAVIARGPFAASNITYDLELTRERVARGARHFWSNA